MCMKNKILSGLFAFVLMISASFFAFGYTADAMEKTPAAVQEETENTKETAAELIERFKSAEKAVIQEQELHDLSTATQPGTVAKEANVPLEQVKAVYYIVHPEEQPTVSGMNQYGSAIIAIAKKYLGVPYVWASADPSKGFDCSGFVNYVYNSAGIHFASRSCEGIYRIAQKVNVPTEGDIIFFVDPETRSKLTHVGLYIGDGKMIDAGTSGIRIADLSISYWQARIFAYGRVIPEDTETDEEKA